MSRIDQLLSTPFVAPIVKGRLVRLSLWGHPLEMLLDGAPLEGWYWLRAIAPDFAYPLHPAEPRHRRAFLEGRPAQHARLLWPYPRTQTWRALLEDSRLVDVYLVRGGRALSRVRVRRDCGQLWYDAPDRTRNPALQGYLETSFARGLLPGHLAFPRLRHEDRVAYAALRHYRGEIARERHEDRVRHALAHADARLVSMQEVPRGLRVVWEKNGRSHQADVAEDLTVVTAGICLSGHDRVFDLASLVTVFDEARQKGLAA